MIAIKDKMPKCCGKCKYGQRFNPDEDICRIDGHIIKSTLATITQNRDSNCPLVEIEERKSGLHWIERFDNEDKWLECPYCHKDSDNAYNYCPNCGAEMRGNEE